ncbi:ferrochelatase [Vibrio sp. UCD-FRSSP16_10]|uniref:precorrin-2 dehydrogenase/sirohydrochlorin ferrochelatase family protein n=1 Tax=unclassified Vibrio TaxID=2614977 RepID=UPI0007FC32E4|nr:MULTISPECIES: bifunctional precorrin-2 dehydrogenase/sirohydrochlorin ferrochelatase [unclassified Vibrio]OBT13501.1 ferrochelatase [Vibrio sp. UCD-FRSSP16_30]OBT19960.1 ferrochelatase [Vibrio sp. UCD-FRSSP16_10]
MRYFPLFYDLNQRPVLVVGGGEVASRKVESLLNAGAYITVVSPTLEECLLNLVHSEKIHWIKGFYQQHLIDEFVQIWATTDNPELNHRVHRDAKLAGIMVNVVDDTDYCDFITPSMINRGRIQVAFSSGGGSPVLIRNLRRTFEAVLPQNLGLLADFATSKRNDIKQSLPDVTRRRLFWEQFFEAQTVKSASSLKQLDDYYQSMLSESKFEPAYSVTWIETGEDFEMLTLKALRLMQSAEMVLYYQGIDEVFIESCRRDAQRKSWQHIAQLSTELELQQAQSNSVVVLLPVMSKALKSELSLCCGTVSILSFAR